MLSSWLHVAGDSIGIPELDFSKPLKILIFSADDRDLSADFSKSSTKLTSIVAAVNHIYAHHHDYTYKYFKMRFDENEETKKLKDRDDPKFKVFAYHPLHKQLRRYGSDDEASTDQVDMCSSLHR
jgi:hypothetical protein